MLALVGVGFCARRRATPHLVLLSWVVAFYVVIGPGRTLFFRYALPLFPSVALLAAIALRHLSQSASVLRTPIACAMGIAIVVAGPAWASTRLVSLMGREDTRVQARKWIEANVPEGQTIRNEGGPFGDVQIRDVHGEGWWIPYFYRTFSPPEKVLADFVERRIDDSRPLYQTSNPIMAVLSPSDTELSPSLVVTHEHPLPYSSLTEDQVKSQTAGWTLLARFSPGLPKSVQDEAFYLPMGNFGELERGGPLVSVWGKGPWQPNTLRASVSHRFARFCVWRGNAYRKGGQLTRALQLYGRALAFDDRLTEAGTQLIAALCITDNFEIAFDVLDISIRLGVPFDEIVNSVLDGRAGEGRAYYELATLARHINEEGTARHYAGIADSLGYRAK